MVLTRHRVLMLLLFFMLNVTGHSYAEDNVITVDLKKEIGVVNKKIFGNNLIIIDNKKHNHSNFGNGIWNPDSKRSVNVAVNLAKSAGLSIMRFNTGNHLDWKTTIGKNRTYFWYGIDEIMKSMDEIGTEPVFVISYFTGDEEDASDLVEYLNAQCDEEHPWACKRALNGHPEPYGVKYFEFGNEVFVYWSKRHNYKVTPEEYASKYLAYRRSMKSVDDSVQLGLNIHHYNIQWDRQVLEVVGSNFDYIVRHLYPPKDLSYYNSTDHYKEDEIFEVIMGSLHIYTDKQFARNLEMIKSVTGKNDAGIAISEFNIGLTNNEPLYRHSLGAALLNADLLRIFLKPENKVLMANYWEFLNGTWGMVRSKDNYFKHDYSKQIDYIKRPSFYVFNMYNNHFGDVLMDVEVESSFYDMGKYKKYMKALNRKHRNESGMKSILHKAIDKFAPFMTAPDQIKMDNTSVSIDFIDKKWRLKQYPGVITEEENGILKIELKNVDKLNSIKAVKSAIVLPDSYYKLSGYVRAEQLNDNGEVFIEIAEGKKCSVARPASHPDEAIDNSNWQYVEALYKTGSDAGLVEVRVGVKGNKTSLNGKIFFKDVTIENYALPDTLVPYLSVNASRNKKGDKIYLMIINKNANDVMPALVHLKNFSSSNTADVWILNGPSIDATNEEITDNVKVVHKKIDITNDSFKYSFEPHSLTAIEVMAGNDL